MQIRNKGHLTFRAQPIWAKTHLAGYLGQQMGPCFANGLIVGPLNVKPFDPFQGHLLCVTIKIFLLLFKVF
jgi:hypothetical protein